MLPMYFISISENMVIVVNYRDYLNDNFELAKEYEKLKQDLFNKYKPNRDLYTLGKTDFVNKIITLARPKYKDRY